MHAQLDYALEAHATAATLYLRGTLLPHTAVGAFRACFTLPERVRRLQVDLRGVHVPDAASARTLSILLDHWRASRSGMGRARSV